LSPEVLGIHRVRLVESLGHTRNDPGYLQLLLAREELRQAVLSTMADYGLDAFVYASVDHHPDLIPDDVLTREPRLSARGPLSARAPTRARAASVGFPAIVVPGVFADDLPVGIEILGRAFGEGDLLKIAYAYEQAPHPRRPPWPAPPLPGEP